MKSGASLDVDELVWRVEVLLDKLNGNCIPSLAEQVAWLKKKYGNEGWAREADRDRIGKSFGDPERPRELPIPEHVLALEPLTIQKAVYGLGSRNADVTVCVGRHVMNNRLRLYVSNRVLGVDPYRGKRKQLTVTYSRGGLVERSVSAMEGEILEL